MQRSSRFGRTMILGRAYESFGWLWVEAAEAYETLKCFSSARKVGGGPCEMLRVLRITIGKQFFTSSRNSRCVGSGYASDRSWKANRMTWYFKRVFTTEKRCSLLAPKVLVEKTVDLWWPSFPSHPLRPPNPPNELNRPQFAPIRPPMYKDELRWSLTS